MRVDRKIMSFVTVAVVAGCAGGSVVRGSQSIPESDNSVLAPKLGPTVCGVEPRGVSNTFCTTGIADTPEGRQGYASACCFTEGASVVWPFEKDKESLVAKECVQDRCYFEEKK